MTVRPDAAATLPLGNATAHATFRRALDRDLHHAWLLAGPEGIGKASFARAAALRMLAEATAGTLPHGYDVPVGDRTRSLFTAGTHPDYRELVRLPKDPEKPDQDVARSISIAQVRALGPMFATAPSMSHRRVVLIDAIDDLERGGANALLKNLEEPPAGTIFLLVSHAPGRLLPTIRSRCRLLRFDPLDAATMGQVLATALPDEGEEERDAMVRAGQGAPARALGLAGLDLAALDDALRQIASTGDADNALRSKLAKQLAIKAATKRYDAFLDRAPRLIADAARHRSGTALKRALDLYEAARELATSARALSLDQQASVFEMAGIVAGLAAP